MAEQRKAQGEKKSSKKLIIILVSLIVVLAAGAGGYFFLAGGGGEAASDESEQSSQAPPELFYYDLSKPLIVNFPAGSAMRLVQVSISLLVDSQSAVETLNKHEPMIRNNLLMLISSQNADELMTHEGKDALREAVLKEITMILEKVAGKSYVTEVFFTSFVMQ